MTKLHLGVVDFPYSYDQQAVSKKGKPLKKKRRVTKSITTGEVAEFIENEYHVMESFFEVHGDEVMNDIVDAYEGSLDNMLLGGPSRSNPGQEGLEKAEQRFRDFLANREMDTMGVPGIPTQAALEGVSHRFAHPYAKRSERPSFIDTGTYASAFKAWMAEF